MIGCIETMGTSTTDTTALGGGTLSAQLTKWNAQFGWPNQATRCVDAWNNVPLTRTGEPANPEVCQGNCYMINYEHTLHCTC